MLNRLVIAGFLLGCIGGAWSQVPRNGSGQDQKSQTNQNQPQTTRPNSLRFDAQVKAATEKQGTDSKPSSYPWRELYGPANIPNWVLCLIGGIASVAAFSTLTTIKRQADLMKEQSDLMVSKERARLRFELDSFSPESNKATIGYKVKGTVSIFGSTEAFIEKTVFFAGIQREDEGEVAIIPAPMAEFPNVIRPGSDPLKTWTILWRTKFTSSWVPTANEGIDDVLKGESIMFCRGAIHYADVFDGKWVFRFSRRYRVYLLPDRKVAGGYWEDFGKPEDNGEYKAN